MASYSIKNLGVIGLTNVSALACIIFYRFALYLYYMKLEFKKTCIYILLLLSCIFELPMNFTFITIEDYYLPTYSFHRLVSATLFMAYSITLSDWTAVVFQIHEESSATYLFHRYTLIFVNFIFVSISLINFIWCFTVSSLNGYTDSYVYSVCKFIQILAPIILTGIMLYSGIKLLKRIRSASGFKNGHRVTTPNTENQLFSAVLSLTNVMACCALFLTVQAVYGILNIMLGYSNDPYATVGPYYLHFLFLYWVPMWAISLSLLYLMRRGELKSRYYRTSDNKYDQLLPADEESFNSHDIEKHVSQKTTQDDLSSLNRESRNSRKLSDCSSPHSFHSGNSNGQRNSLNGHESTSKCITCRSSISHIKNDCSEKIILVTEVPSNCDNSDNSESSTHFDTCRYNTPVRNNKTHEASFASESRSTSTTDNDSLSKDCAHSDLMMFTGMGLHNSLTFLGSPATIFSPSLSGSNAVASPTEVIVENILVSEYNNNDRGLKITGTVDSNDAFHPSTVTS